MARKWSARVTRESHALALEDRVFTRSARGIALSLKRSALSSRERKARPFQSAMSMLNFYINRAGRNMTGPERKRLEQAKDELRDLFHRPVKGKRRPDKKERLLTASNPGALRRRSPPRNPITA